MKKGRCKRHALNDSIYMKQPVTVTRLEGTSDCRRVGREVAHPCLEGTGLASAQYSSTARCMHLVPLNLWAFCGNGHRTQGFTHVRQAHYSKSCVCSQSLLFLFCDRVSKLPRQVPKLSPKRKHPLVSICTTKVLLIYAFNWAKWLILCYLVLLKLKSVMAKMQGF